MTTTLHQSKPEGLEQAIELIRLYAAESALMFGDTILSCPILQGGSASKQNRAKSEDCAMDGLIASSRYHAAKDILILLGEDVSDL